MNEHVEFTVKVSKNSRRHRLDHTKSILFILCFTHVLLVNCSDFCVLGRRGLVFDWF